jgi:hypothetical protein
VLACLQSNLALDAVLAFLLSELTSPASPSLEPDCTYTLAYTLALISASHPDATSRLITFRLLALCISLLPAHRQLALLAELLMPMPEIPPQLRVAAIGLARDAVLRALSEPSPSPLASPQLLRVLGPVLFCTEPADLLDDLSKLDVSDFLSSVEPKRLIECLGFYYVVSARDTQNRVRYSV